MPTHANKSYGWIKREGKLGGPGYTKKTTAARHRILAGVVKKYGYRSALGSIMALERSTQISATVRKVLVADRNWLRETYGAAAKKRAAAARPIRRRSIPADSRVPAAPRARVEIRDALERAGFRLLGTGKSVSYTARGEKGPRVIAPFPKTLTAARTLIKRAKAGSRSSAAAPRRRSQRSQSVSALRATYDREVAAGDYGAAELTFRAIRAAQGKPVGRMASRADRIGMLTPGWRPNPAIRDGFTRVDTVMVRHKPFMDIYRGPPIPKHRGMYPYYGVVRSTGEVTETMRVRAALGPVELLGQAEAMAENAGLLKRPEKERGTRKRRSRMPAGVSADVYLESQATALFDRKMPEYEDPGKYYFSNPRLPMGATKYMSVYAAVPTLAHDSIKQQRQKVADIYRSRKGGYFVIYTVGSLPHTIVDNEDGTLKSMKDEVVAYIMGTTDILQAKGKNDYRALRFVLAKGEKTPDLKLMLNGRSECGYHGVPTIRGECVVCAYEADVR